MEMGLNEAHVKHYKGGSYDIKRITIDVLPCDNRIEHYPNFCYHYRYTIES